MVEKEVEDIVLEMGDSFFGDQVGQAVVALVAAVVAAALAALEVATVAGAEPVVDGKHLKMYIYI